MSASLDALIRERLPRVVAMAPEGIDDWGVRVQARDRVSRGGYRWSAPGTWAHAPGEVLAGEECATDRTGGIHVARQWSGTFSTVRVDRIAVVGWSAGDVRGSSEDKVRVTRAWVGALLTIPAALRLLGGANLGGANLLRADLRRAYLRGAYLGGADLGGADLGGANLLRADLYGANLGGANLGGANLLRADLRRADLRRAYLRGAYLGGADLGGADLGGANLLRADLYGANLGGANLGGANLGGANLRRADLRRADLRRAYLRGADLYGAYGVPSWAVEAAEVTR